MKDEDPLDNMGMQGNMRPNEASIPVPEGAVIQSGIPQQRGYGKETEKIGEILIKEGAATREEVENALLIQKKIREEIKKGRKIQDLKLGEILLNQKAARKTDITNALLFQEKIKSEIQKGEKNQDLKLAEILVKNGVITTEQLDRAIDSQKFFGGSIVGQLIKLGFIRDSELVTFLSREFGTTTVNLFEEEIPENIIKLIPPEIAIKNNIIPFNRQGNTLYLAVSDPTKIEALDDIKFLTGLNVEVVVTSESGIAHALSKYYNASTILAENVEYLKSIELEGTSEEINIAELSKSASEAPIIKFANKVIADAVKAGASDIHIEPYESNLRLRYRIDGKLVEQMKLPIQLKNPVVSRIKIMSLLDIAEKRLPQDGRIKVRVDGKEIDIRVSCLPSLFGEKIVMRILDKSSLQLDMKKLGFSEEQLSDFRSAIHKPYGMILVTGPTGSGKTTTLYSGLSEVNKPDVNISTAEDPVEYNIPGINQVNVNEEIGYNFAMALRSFLRQDPDIIMVGEIRDLETAEIAVKAALTGHLVFSTVHTNNAASTIPRLINMGVEKFLIASSLNLIIAQRLVRRLCNECKEAYYPDAKTLFEMGLNADDASTHRFFQPKGCPVCNKTGYKGRIAIYEVLNVTEDIKTEIYKMSNEFEIEKIAIKNGMKTLRDSAVEKFVNGVTSLNEILQYLGSNVSIDLEEYN